MSSVLLWYHRIPMWHSPRFWRWVSVLWMGVIFWFSSQPQLPTAPGWWDILLKKTAHLMAYAVLGFALAQGWGGSWRTWLVAVLYAVSDEVHQAFVPGRHPWAVDVGIDAVGAALGLWGWTVLRARQCL